jgi:hypothetical protein
VEEICKSLEEKTGKNLKYCKQGLMGNCGETSEDQNIFKNATRKTMLPLRGRSENPS